MAAQGVGIGQGVTPDLALDVAPADHARRLAHEDGQELQADRRHHQILPGALHAQGGHVQTEVAHAQGLGADQAAVTTDEGAHARLQLADLEGLDEVVVGAGIETGELVVKRVARREHQYRRGLLRLLAQAPTQVQAVHAGQHEVEHDHVVAVLGGQAQAARTVAGVVHAESAVFQVFTDHAGDAAVVFDQQNEAGLLFARLHGALRRPLAGAVFTFVKYAGRAVIGP